MQKTISKWTMKDDTLYIVDGGEQARYRYQVCTWDEGRTFTAEGVTYENDGRGFDRTGNEFHSLIDAEDFVSSFGFTKA